MNKATLKSKKILNCVGTDNPMMIVKQKNINIIIEYSTEINNPSFDKLIASSILSGINIAVSYLAEEMTELIKTKLKINE